MEYIPMIASVITIIGFVYGIVRNFRKDFSEKINTLEDRMFQLATGKTLAQAILEEKMKETK